MKKKKILIAPEMADMAETHRMAGFAKALHELGHEVIVLGSGRYDYLFKSENYKRVYIAFDDEWMDDEKFRKMHDFDNTGFDFISSSDLEKFVKLEIELLRKLNPDAVITGFRPSLSISTKITGTTLVWVLSAVFSDMYFENDLANPFMFMYNKIPLFRILPSKIVKKLFKKIVLNSTFKLQAWNRVMKKFGLKKFKTNFQVTRGDFNIMSDARELFTEFGKLPQNYSFCGPLLYNGKINMPESVSNFRAGKKRPVIFFAMGSSGEPGIFISIIAGFNGQPFDVFAASMSIIKKEDIPFIPENVIVEKMYPAFEITKMADVAVIHGGQGTVYTTIMAGTPFVGIPMFGEQQYNLENLERKGCGIVISRYELSPEKINKAINTIISNTTYKKQAMDIQSQLLKYKNNTEFEPSMKGAKDVIDYINKKERSA